MCIIFLQAKKALKSKDKKRKGQNIDNDEEYSPSKKKKRPKLEPDYEPEPEEYIPPEKIKKEKGKTKKPVKATPKQETKVGKKGVKKEEPEVWKWWEEEKKDDGKKWHFLQHNGPLFAPEYERLPSKVRFYSFNFSATFILDSLINMLDLVSVILNRKNS